MGDNKYRKRPVVIEAHRWTGDNLEEIQGFVGVMENMDGDASTTRFLEPEARNDEGERIWNNPAAHLWAEANKTWVPVPKGQWVLKDSAGFYPCKHSIFEATYEKV